jgi:O-antigen/teichoic acid export membrane protein
MLAGAPISIVLMPLMAKLHAQSNNKEMIEEYRKGTQLACVIVISVSAVMAFFVYPVLYGWTGDLNLVKNIAPIFVLYTMGNAMLVLSAFPYYLQYAIGNLRLHVLGNIAFVIILVPSVIWAARSYGGMGAASVWFATNSLFFLLWVPFVHSRLAPGLNYRWYTIDILSIIIPTVVTAYLLNFILPGTGERWLGLVIAMSSGIVVLIIGFLSASSLRTVMIRYISGWYRRYL